MAASDKCTHQIKNVLLYRSHPNMPFAAGHSEMEQVEKPTTSYLTVGT